MERINEHELARLKELMRQTGEFIAYFELADTKMAEWCQDIEYQASVQQKLLHQMKIHQQELAQLTQQAISKIEEQGSQAITHIEQSAQNTMVNSEKSLNKYQWHSIVLSLLTTLLTTFALGLYMSDEYPWEVHQRALNERGAGIVLINAWPKLSQQEKTKILSTKTA